MKRVKKAQTPLKLAANNCVLFVVTVEIAEKDFLRNAFVQALPHDIADSFEKERFLDGYFDRQSKQVDYQAHIYVHSANKNKESPKLHFVVTLRPTSRLRRTQEDPPFAEGAFQWIHQFISDDADISLREQAVFTFSTNHFRSVFSLPTILSGPLNHTEHEVFESAGIIGMSLAPKSNKVGVDMAEQTVIEKSIVVTLNRRLETNAQKLFSIEGDVAVLRTVAFSTVRLKRRIKK